MSLKTLAAGVFACAMATGMAFANVKAADVSPWGNWMLTDGRLTVNVFQCQGDKVCANVAKLDNPNNPDGTPKLDLKNKNPSLRSRRLIGMPVIVGMTSSGPNKWSGNIYSSDDGNTYAAYATINGDKLDVKGCFLIICKDLNFVRAK